MMRALRWLRYIALAIPAVAAPLRAQDRLLVPGNPPLTEAAAAGAAQFYEWALDVRLSEAQWSEFERLLVDRWKQPGGAARAEILSTSNRWSEIVGMRVTTRGEIQPRVQDSILSRLRGSTGGSDAAHWLLARYAEAHQTLAPGNPPLTKVLADRMADYWEWVLDVELGDRDRQELQQFQIAQWAHKDAAWKRTWITIIPAWWTTMANLGPVERTLLRVEARTNVLKEVRGDPSEPFNRWRFARYQAAHSPGGERNRILVPGATPLTQDMVTQYCEYVEWRWRLQLTGLGAQQRQQLQHLVIADWKSRDEAARQAFLDDLRWWQEVFPGLSDADRQNVIYKNLHMGAYVERLHRSPNVDASSWYLALESLTLETFRWRAAMQNMYIQTWRSMIESNRATMTQIARNMAPSGRYEYDPQTGGYDRYVPYF
jgi:hypothetical protein